MYKTLGGKRLFEIFCPALAYVSADKDEARNPQRFIHASVMRHFKKNINDFSNFLKCPE
jgi:hypothetical protein